MTSKLNPGELIGDALAMIVARPGGPLVAVGLLTAIGAVIDASGEVRFTFLSSLASLFAQYILTTGALRHRGLMVAEGAPGRVSAYIIAGILTGLAILVGLIALAIPGVYLIARWFLVTPTIIAEGLGATEAMSASWARAKGNLIAILLAFLPAAVLFVAGVGVPAFYVETASQELLYAISIASNLLVSLTLIFCWFLTVSAYARTAPTDRNLSAVFA